MKTRWQRVPNIKFYDTLCEKESTSITPTVRFVQFIVLWPRVFVAVASTVCEQVIEFTDTSPESGDSAAGFCVDCYV